MKIRIYVFNRTSPCHICTEMTNIIWACHESFKVFNCKQQEKLGYFERILTDTRITRCSWVYTWETVGIKDNWTLSDDSVPLSWKACSIDADAQDAGYHYAYCFIGQFDTAATITIIKIESIVSPLLCITNSRFKVRMCV